jgi:DNA-binding NarL/FixJ family response regulator
MIDKDLYIQFLESMVKKQNPKPKDELAPRRVRNKAHHWTTAEKIKVMQLHEAGYTPSQIAPQLGLRTNQVANMIYSILRRNKVA